MVYWLNFGRICGVLTEHVQCIGCILTGNGHKRFCADCTLAGEVVTDWAWAET